MARLAALLALLATTVGAWEFRADPICTIEHENSGGQVTVTFDPLSRLYGIDLTLAEGQWPDAPAFGILFAGGNQIQIGTDRHQLLEDGATLRVTDEGFGNVLDGLEFNLRAFAKTGGQIFVFELMEAAPAVQAFRDCGTTLSS